MYLNLSEASSTNTGYDTTTNDTPTNICIRYQFSYITELQFSRTRRHEKMIQKKNKKKKKRYMHGKCLLYCVSYTPADLFIFICGEYAILI